MKGKSRRERIAAMSLAERDDLIPLARKVVDGWPSMSPSIDTARAEVCNGAMKRVTAFAVLLVVLATPAWAGWDEGVVAYDRSDYATAFREMKPLAEQGDAVAQFNLGNMYRTGRGVPQDYAEAERWYRRAVEQGNASAQFNLGVKYYNSLPQDYAEAAKWFRKAANQGNADAQYHLGVIYDKGYDLPQDYVQAHMWYSLAEAQGRTAAAWGRGRVAKRMTPAQIAVAQRRARGWKPK